MIRTSNLKSKWMVVLCFYIMGCNVGKQSNNRSLDIPTPTPAQLAWQQAELGVLICYELHTFNAGRYVQSQARVNSIQNVNQFNPTELDTDQWIKTVKDMGARFAILTASHESGFRLWQSDANPYCLKAVKWGDGKRDIVAEFVASCRKYDIKPGIYLGTRWNSHLGIYDFKVTDRSTITQAEYNAMIEAEVEEICSRYGELFEIWFDGGAYGPKDGGPDVLGIFERCQPNCLFYHNYQRADARWGGSETGTVPYPCWARLPFEDGYAAHSQESYANNFQLLKYGDINGQYWCPAMSDVPLRGYGGHEWFWDAGDDHKVFPLNMLMDKYYKSIGRNSTLIVGLTPDNRGLMPEVDVKRCQEWGRKITSIFSHPIGSTSGNGNTLELNLSSSRDIDHIAIQEDIRHGERVRQYVMEYKKDGVWVQLTSGSCIGHKRIHEFQAIQTNAIRLRITNSIAKPIILNLSVYDSQLNQKPALSSPDINTAFQLNLKAPIDKWDEAIPLGNSLIRSLCMSSIN
ncbi:MAG: alpha-L-fucosidase [Phycisphaerae bacterium]|nr:alpha-L-fucosidase [Phycisphaerae bacterium]